MSRITVFGLGRSGLAVARAANKLGDAVKVVDQKSLSGLAKPDLYLEGIRQGIDIELEWNGTFSNCDVVVSNPAVPRNHASLKNAERDGIEVISEVEYAYRIAKVPIVAITGTNGKSTTTVMTYLALQDSGVEAVLCGNIYGSGYPETTLTDAASDATQGQILVAEISSFQLEWVSQFKPIAAGITNITSDHLDRYDGKVEEYRATKLRIFDAQDERDLAVLDSSIARPNGPKVTTFGPADADAHPTAKGIWVRGKQIEDLPFREPHNRLNACCAALLAQGALEWIGLPTDDIANGLRSFRGLAHRMQFLGERDGVAVINNSMCTNPDAVIQSVASVGMPTHLLVGGVNKGIEFDPLCRYLQGKVHKVYLFGRDQSEIDQMLGGGNLRFETMQQAFERATHEANVGEAIMLSPGCASSDQFKDFVDRGNVFAGIAKEWLNQ